MPAPSDRSGESRFGKGRPDGFGESSRPSRGTDADGPGESAGRPGEIESPTDSGERGELAEIAPPAAPSLTAVGSDELPSDPADGERSRRGGPERDREVRERPAGPEPTFVEDAPESPSALGLADPDHQSHSSDDSRRGRYGDDRHEYRPGGERDRYRDRRVSSLASNTSLSRHWDPRWTSRDSVWSHSHTHSSNSNFYISINFSNSLNYAYRPTAWGYHPWWSSHSAHSWHCGTWSYSWNNRWRNRYYYYSRPVVYYPPGYSPYYYGPSSVIPWGLAAWSLGSVYYDTGYSTYWNPYPAPPIQTRTTIINYSQPITVVARDYQPAPEEIALNPAEKSSAALERSRAAFKRGDYLTASQEIDEALSFEPGDPALHEYRALVLFALGRYGDAAGVLNPVLASGPGWDWETMIGLYRSPDAYTEHFRKLEQYVVAMPDTADAHFLLGYHYLVGGHLKEAYAMFDRVHVLQPADSVARQLRSLVADSVPTDEPLPSSALAEVKKAPVAKEALHGVWRAVSADGKEISLSLTEIGTFSWNFEGAKSGEVLSGEWSINEDGFLVLADKDVQLVADISLKDLNTMQFLLAGSPEGDPGLLFERP